jgi:prepilin peptidase dependent protein B
MKKQLATTALVGAVSKPDIASLVNPRMSKTGADPPLIMAGNGGLTRQAQTNAMSRISIRALAKVQRDCSRSIANLGERQQGFSLIELMVGIAVGMIVVAGASLMMTSQLADHRRLMLETQVQQDLRAVADLILRDLRRAGSRALPQNGLWSADSVSVTPNVYAEVSLGAQEEGSVLEYSYSRHKNRTQTDATPIADSEDDALSSSTERFGFKIEDGGILKFRLGDRWQPLTDKHVLVVTAFNIALHEQQLVLDDLCGTACPAGSANCPPSQTLRRCDISLTGHAVHDAQVQRTIKVTSRIRNDQITGSCP